MDIYRWLTSQWDRTLAIGLAVLGALALVLGYIGVANAVVPAAQIPYLASGAVGGLFCLGLGATLWLSADARDEWRKIDELLDEVRDLNARGAETQPSSRRASTKPAS